MNGEHAEFTFPAVLFLCPRVLSGEPSWILSFIEPNILQHNIKLEKKTTLTSDFCDTERPLQHG
jgi:hypothetical protein